MCIDLDFQLAGWPVVGRARRGRVCQCCCRLRFVWLLRWRLGRSQRRNGWARGRLRSDATSRARAAWTRVCRRLCSSLPACVSPLRFEGDLVILLAGVPSCWAPSAPSECAVLCADSTPRRLWPAGPGLWWAGPELLLLSSVFAAAEVEARPRARRSQRRAGWAGGRLRPRSQRRARVCCGAALRLVSCCHVHESRLVTRMAFHS